MPHVSIILPTYNRAQFLSEAIAAIRNQQFTDWELIVVDDGSTDGTGELISSLCAGMSQPLQYIRQSNQGAYSARNRGLVEAKGDFIAFYDSDDLWLPHHLKICAEALQENKDIDWVYGASRIVDCIAGQICSENCFYVDGQPRPFLNHGSVQRGLVRVLEHEGLLLSVLKGAGLFAGLQASVIRSSIFRGASLPEGPVAEAIGDQLFIIRCLKAEARFAYSDRAHFEYRIHASNSCAAGATAGSTARRQRVYEAAIRGMEELLAESSSREERRAIRGRLAGLYFWNLGYTTHLQNGDYPEALKAFKKGLSLRPMSRSFWKTYLFTRAKWICRSGNNRNRDYASVIEVMSSAD